MKVLSLFSGVGGFDLGLERAGMETVFQCEWDKHATKILERHWPDTPRWTDVSTLTGAYVLQHAPIIDVVAWGSPCQDLSVAGKRAGLSGERSGLFHEGIRIIKEIREITNGQYPRFSIWENVAGALSSSNGADFGEVLYEMDEAGACFSEWRLLDAQYFGVPQRRRRVFVISVFDSATAARCPNPLLPVSESVRRDTPTGGTPGQEPTRTAKQGIRSSRAIIGSDIVGSLAASDWKFPQQQQVHENKCVVETFTKAKRAQTTTDDETWVEGKPAPTLNSFNQGDTRATTVVVGSLESRDYKGANHEGARDGKLILEPILIDGRRVDDVRVYDPPVQTLQARMGTGGNNVPVIGFSHTQGLSAQPSETAWPTLRKEGAGHAVAIPIQDGRDIEKHQNGIGIGEEGAPSYTLDQTEAQAVAYAFDSLSSNSMKSSNPNSGVRVTEIAKTLDTARPDPSCNQGGIAITQPVTYGIQGNVIGRQDHNGPAGKGHTEEGDPMVAQAIPIHDQATRHSGKRGTKSDGKGNGFGIGNEGDPMNTLTSGDRHAVAYTLREREGKPGGGKGPLVTPEKSGTLAARSNDQTVFQPQAVAYDEYNDTLGGDVHHALRAGTKQSTGVVVDNEIVGTLRSDGDGGVPSSRGEHLVVSEAAGFKAGQGAQAGSIGYQEGRAQTLTSDMNGLEPTVLTPTMAVRRLTPVECERLMGWPDGWTDGQADTHRYKQCGNGVASPVATWIGQQIINL